eukprot:gene22514-26727_t
MKTLVLKKHLYQQIAEGFEQQIRSKVLVPGDKLPSLRLLCEMHGISQSTAMKVYYELEAKGLALSRPQSGYFVSVSMQRHPQLPQTSTPSGQHSNIDAEEIIERVFSVPNPGNIMLSNSVPANELLPIAKLNKAMVQ